MFQLVIALIVGQYHFRYAAQNRFNPWIWSVIGVLAFLVFSSLAWIGIKGKFSSVYESRFYSVHWNDIRELFASMLIGILFSYLLFRILKRMKSMQKIYIPSRKKDQQQKPGPDDDL